jgi:hypothetical protein
MISDAPARSPHVLALVFAWIGLMLAALPFLAVDYVPATDLPQHAAQIRPLRELWGLAPLTVDASQLVARPFGANTLCYWPMLALSAVFPSPETIAWFSATSFNSYSVKKQQLTGSTLSGLIFGPGPVRAGLAFCPA